MRDRPPDSAAPAEVALLETASRNDSATGGCLDVLAGAEPRTRDVLAVTYGREPEFVVDAWRRHVGSEPGNLAVVAAGDETRSVGSAVTKEPSPNVVRAVQDPENFAETRRLVVEFLDAWSDTGNSTVVYVDSVSTLARLVGTGPAVRHVREVVELLAPRDCLGYFRYDDCDGDDDLLARLEPEFDSVRRVAAGSSRGQGPDGSGRVRRERHEPPLAVDDAFDLLSASHRRIVLTSLDRTDGPVAVEELAERIAEREHGRVTDDARRRAYVALRHVHLPKLEELDAVTVDRTRNTVEPRGDAVEWLEPVLAFAARADDR